MSLFSANAIPRVRTLGEDLAINPLSLDSPPYPFAGETALAQTIPVSSGKPVAFVQNMYQGPVSRMPYVTYSRSIVPEGTQPGPDQYIDSAAVVKGATVPSVLMVTLKYNSGMDRMNAGRALSSIIDQYAFYRTSFLDSYDVRCFMAQRAAGSTTDIWNATNLAGGAFFHRIIPKNQNPNTQNIDFAASQNSYFDMLRADLQNTDFTGNDLQDFIRNLMLAPFYGVSLYDQENWADPMQSVEVYFLNAMYMDSSIDRRILTDPTPLVNLNLPPDFYHGVASEPMFMKSRPYLGYNILFNDNYRQTIENLFYTACVTRVLNEFHMTAAAAQTTDKSIVNAAYSQWVNYNQNIGNYIDSSVPVSIVNSVTGTPLYFMRLSIPEKIKTSSGDYFPRRRLREIYTAAMSHAITPLYASLGVRAVELETAPVPPPSTPDVDIAWQVDAAATANSPVVIYRHTVSGERFTSTIPTQNYRLAVQKGTLSLRFPTTAGGGISAVDLSNLGVEQSSLAKYLPLAAVAATIGILKAKAII